MLNGRTARRASRKSMKEAHAERCAVHKRAAPLDYFFSPSLFFCHMASQYEPAILRAQACDSQIASQFQREAGAV